MGDSRSPRLNLFVAAVPLALALASVAGLVGFWTAPAARAASIWYVDAVSGSDQAGCGAGAGASACQSINGLLGAQSGNVLSGDTVWLAPGTYTERVTIGMDLTLLGQGATPLDVVIDGGEEGRVLLALGNLVLENLTVQNGRINGVGAGIYAVQALTLRQVNVYSNTSTSSSGGGGAYVVGDLTASDTIFMNNQSPSGSGGAAYANAAATLSAVLVLTNTAQSDGGGLYLAGAVDLTGGEFRGNSTSTGGGGGLFVLNGPLSAAHTTFTGNQAYYGGGGAYVSGAHTISDTVFLDNTTTFDGSAGAALDISGGGDGQLVNLLLVGNTNPSLGGALQIMRGSDVVETVLHSTIVGDLNATEPLVATYSPVVFTNTLIADGVAGVSVVTGDCLADYNLFYNSPVSGCALGAHNVSDQDPRFVDPAAGNYHLQFGSPAYTAGVNVDVSADLDGNPRPSSPSIGAYEGVPAPHAVLQKVASPAVNVHPRSVVTYTLQVSNVGALTEPQMRVTDTLPAGVAFGGWIAQPAGTDYAAGTLTWAGAVTTSTPPITMVFTVTHTGGEGDVITNTALYSNSMQTGSAAATFAVNSCYATPNHGVTVFATSSASAVQQAIDAVGEGGTVKIAGTCNGVQVVDLHRQLAYISGKALTLAGGYTLTNWLTANAAAHPTILDAQGGGRVIWSTGTVITVTNLTVQNGGQGSHDNGGGIFAEQGGLTLLNSRVLSNTAYDGGGVSVYGGSGPAVISGTLFQGNQAYDYGGGLNIEAGDRGPAYITNTDFIDNRVRPDGDPVGAAIYIWEPTEIFGGRIEGNQTEGHCGGIIEARAALTITGTHFIANTTCGGVIMTPFEPLKISGALFQENTASNASYGGAISAWGQVDITHTDFISNTGGSGGAIWGERGALTIAASLFRGNQSQGSGGALLWGGPAVVSATQFINNSAAGSGGAVYSANILGESPSGRFVNVLFAGNRADGTGQALYHDSLGALSLLFGTVADPAGNAGTALYINQGMAFITNTLVASYTTGLEINADSEATAVSDYNLFFNAPTAVAAGAHSILDEDPLFLNPGAGDYRPQTDSPVAGAGHNEGVLTDLAGKQRADPPAIGAYEAVAKIQPIYLPLIMKNYAAGPDLVVVSLSAYTNTVQVAIKNQGDMPVVNEFWVDVYLNPTTPPTRPRPWQLTGGQGLAWGITAAALPQLVPGGMLTLTVNGPYFSPDLTRATWPLPVGTRVYAQVDSVNYSTSYGAVLESHEIAGLSYNNILGPVLAAASAPNDIFSAGLASTAPASWRGPVRP